jgi:hypothetical protein
MTTPNVKRFLRPEYDTGEHSIPCNYMRLMLYVCGILIPVLLTVFAWHSGRMSAVEQKSELGAREVVELRTVLKHHTVMLNEIRSDIRELSNRK